MTVNQRLRLIEDHKLMFGREILKVKCGMLNHYGVFIDFDDADELKEQGKVRFVLQNNLMEYQKDLEQRNQEIGLMIGDPKFSMVIDVNDITDISVYDLEQRAVLYSLN